MTKLSPEIVAFLNTRLKEKKEHGRYLHIKDSQFYWKSDNKSNLTRISYTSDHYHWESIVKPLNHARIELYYKELGIRKELSTEQGNMSLLILWAIAIAIAIPLLIISGPIALLPFVALMLVGIFCGSIINPFLGKIFDKKSKQNPIDKNETLQEFDHLISVEFKDWIKRPSTHPPFAPPLTYNTPTTPLASSSYPNESPHCISTARKRK